MIQNGILYIVATPIGNVDDISIRAIDILKKVAKIAAEDTRHSKPLLQKLNIETLLKSYHDFSGDAVADGLIADLLDGQSIALISDAGTPLISDPGFKLVKLARSKGIEVLPIPGASSVTAALSVSGLPTDRFIFEGFLPSKSAARQKRLQEFSQEERTTVFFESTHRIVESLQDMVSVLAKSRQLFIAREISKKFETHFLGSAAECLQWITADSQQQKGEFVMIVEGCDEASIEAARQNEALKIVELLGASVSRKDAVAIASEITGARKNKLYEIVISKKSDEN